MNTTSLKYKLANRIPTIGTWLSLGHAGIAEILVQSGYEWLTIDMEHSTTSLGQAEAIIQVADLGGAAPLVRLSSNDPTQAKRVMDAGAHGIIVPMVNTPEEAQTAVESIHYPPRGKRGVGLSRAQKWGPGFEEYKEWVEKESVVIVQIEHIQAVENLGEILGVEGVDGFIVGPYDLSGSLGVPGSFDHPEMLKAMTEIERVAAESKPAPGFHVVPTQPALVEDKLKAGYTFIAYGVDFMFLGESARQGMQAINSMINDSAFSGNK